jgi:hypothetical protein
VEIGKTFKEINKPKMSYMLFEVWSEDENGHQELIETTASLTAARKIANQTIENGSVAVIIFQETDEGDTKEIERIESD